MANVANECFQLEIPDLYSQNIVRIDLPDSNTSEKAYEVYCTDTLGAILDKQKELQEETYFPNLPSHVSYSNMKFKDMNLRQLKDFLLTNEHALVDELHEMMDALGGIHDGIGAGAWKHWKKDHAKIEEMTLDFLSEKDRIELKFEFIDALHFFMNIAAALQLSSKDIYNYYFSKHRENINRQNNNY